MIYGYPQKTENEYGLVSLKEVSLQANSANLRELANFLLQVADETDSRSISRHWHRHCDAKLARAIGCDFIVSAPTSANAESPVVRPDA
jgi:hypothetical protein